MIKSVLTVTLNPSLDRTICVHGLRLGTTVMQSRDVLSAGGKGLNVSRALKVLGVSSIATGVVGGVTGDKICELIEREKILSKFLEVDEASRVNVTILDLKNDKKTRIMQSGPKVKKNEIDAFKRLFKKLLKRSTLVIFSGRSIYGASDAFLGQLIRMVRQRGLISVLDTSGQSLVLGLKAKPNIIKPNIQEAESVLNIKLNKLENIKKGLREFHRMGIPHVLLSMGKRGAIGSNCHECWYVKPPTIKAQNDVGCGDAFLAGFISSYLKGESFKQMLSFAVASGTANALSLIPGSLKQRDVSKLISRLKIARIAL